MAFLHFPLSEKEMDCLSAIEKQIQLHPDVFPVPEEVIHSGTNLIKEMVAHGIIKDAGIDNCNAYYVTGSILEFKEWIHNNNKNAKSILFSKGSTAMAFEPLSYNCEKLLKDILDHRNSVGMCDLKYWERRFQGLSFSEETALRSQFEILVKRNMIREPLNNAVREERPQQKPATTSAEKVQMIPSLPNLPKQPPLQAALSQFSFK